MVVWQPMHYGYLVVGCKAVFFHFPQEKNSSKSCYLSVRLFYFGGIAKEIILISIKMKLRCDCTCMADQGNFTLVPCILQDVLR